MTNESEKQFIKRAIAATHPTARVEKIALTYLDCDLDSKLAAKRLGVKRNYVTAVLNNICHDYFRVGYIYEDEVWFRRH